MEKGFVCILKPASPPDSEFLREFGAKFACRENYGAGAHSLLWVGDAQPFPYRWGSPVAGREFSEYPESSVEVRPDGLSAMVRTDALGFKSPFVGYAGNAVYLSDSVRSLREAAAFFGSDFPVSETSVLAGIAYQSLPVGRTLLEGVAALPGGTDTEFRIESGIARQAFSERTRRTDFSKIELTEEEAWRDYRDAFEDSVERMVSATEGEPLGVLFSWGFDSSAVLSALVRHGKLRRGGIVPITVTNPRTPFSDDAYSLAVSREIGVERFEVGLAPEDVRLFAESVAAIGDPSDLWWFGMLLKRAFRAAAEKGVRTVVSGSGTDAQVGSTRSVMTALWYLLYWPDSIEKSMSKQKRFADPDGRIADLVSRPVSNPPKLLSRIDSFVYEVTARMPSAKPAPLLPEWAGDAFVSDRPPSAHDLAVLTDLLSNSHRASSLYSAMAKSEGVAHVSPFASSELRRRMFSYPSKYKFDPSRYPVTEWDNQFFYKNALRGLVPEAASNRHKTVWSLSDHRIWLLDDSNVGYFSELLDAFSKRGILPAEYCGRLAEEYSSARWRTTLFESHSETGHSFMLWKIASAELALRSLGK